MTTADDTLNAEAQSQVRSIIEKAERLIEDRKAIVADLADVFTTAKNDGHDVKALRAAIKYRAEDKAKREEMEAIVDLYLHACGDR